MSQHFLLNNNNLSTDVQANSPHRQNVGLYVARWPSGGQFLPDKCSQVSLHSMKNKTPGVNLKAFGRLRFRSSVRTPEEI